MATAPAMMRRISMKLMIPAHFERLCDDIPISHFSGLEEHAARVNPLWVT
jgi:hypothetical protein